MKTQPEMKQARNIHRKEFLSRRKEKKSPTVNYPETNIDVTIIVMPKTKPGFFKRILQFFW